MLPEPVGGCGARFERFDDGPFVGAAGLRGALDGRHDLVAVATEHDVGDLGGVLGDVEALGEADLGSQLLELLGGAGEAVLADVEVGGSSIPIVRARGRMRSMRSSIATAPWNTAACCERPAR